MTSKKLKKSEGIIEIEPPPLEKISDSWQIQGAQVGIEPKQY